MGPDHSSRVVHPIGDAHPAEPIDDSWVRRARDGDQEAFRRIVEQYQQTVHRQMSRFSADASARETLTHDVFVEVYLSLAKFRFRGPFEHWLRKVAVRVGYRHWKTRARERRRAQWFGSPGAGGSAAGGSAVEPTVTDPAARSLEARELLESVLSRLGPRDRLVLTLLYWDGHSVAEAAELAGWTQTMVKVQAHRARKKVKRMLEEQGHA